MVHQRVYGIDAQMTQSRGHSKIFYVQLECPLTCGRTVHAGEASGLLVSKQCKGAVLMKQGMSRFDESSWLRQPQSPTDDFCTLWNLSSYWQP